MARDKTYEDFRNEFENLSKESTKQFQRLKDWIKTQPSTDESNDILTIAGEIQKEINSMSLSILGTNNADEQQKLNAHLQNLNRRLDYFVSFNTRLSLGDTGGAPKRAEIDAFTQDMKNQFTSLLLEARDLKYAKYTSLLEKFIGGVFYLFGSRSKYQIDKTIPVYATEEKISREKDRFDFVKYNFSDLLTNYESKHAKNAGMMVLHEAAKQMLDHAAKVAASPLGNNHEVMALINQDLHNARAIMNKANEGNIADSLSSLQELASRTPDIPIVEKSRTWAQYLYSKLTFRNIVIAAVLLAVVGALLFFSGGTAAIPIIGIYLGGGPALLAAAGAYLTAGAGYAAFALSWMAHALSPMVATAFLQQAVFGTSLAGQVASGMVYGFVASLVAATTLFAGGFGAYKALGWAYNAIAGREPEAKEGMEKAEDEVRTSMETVSSIRSSLKEERESLHQGVIELEDLATGPDGVFGINASLLEEDDLDEEQLNSRRESMQSYRSQAQSMRSSLSLQDVPLNNNPEVLKQTIEEEYEAKFLNTAFEKIREECTSDRQAQEVFLAGCELATMNDTKAVLLFHVNEHSPVAVEIELSEIPMKALEDMRKVSSEDRRKISEAHESAIEQKIQDDPDRDSSFRSSFN